MAKFNQGVYVPENPEKFIGNKYPTYRSSWELSFMKICDKHPNIIQWGSECLYIHYVSPFDGRIHKYYPDFLIYYTDKNGRKIGEIIEIKPVCQTLMELAKSRKDKEAYILNKAKWQAAEIFCKKQGLKFRVMTEHDIYHSSKGKKKR